MNADRRQLPRQPLDGESFDSAIDAVAREMTDVTPSGALRARVLGRLEQERQPAVPSIPRWAWAGGAAAAGLAVAVTVWLARPIQAPRTAEPMAVARHDTAAPVAATRPREPSGHPGSSAVEPARGNRPVVPASVDIVRAETPYADEAASLVSPLSEIQPLRFAAVEPDPLHVAAVEVAPLAPMPSIEVEGLGAGPNSTQSIDSKKENPS